MNTMMASVVVVRYISYVYKALRYTLQTKKYDMHKVLVMDPRMEESEMKTLVLCYASSNGQVDVAEHILKIDISTLNTWGILSFDLGQDCQDIITKAMKDFYQHEVVTHSLTPLVYACANGQLEIVKLFLRMSGVDMDARNGTVIVFLIQRF
jgi:hypothetical protein